MDIIERNPHCTTAFMHWGFRLAGGRTKHNINGYLFSKILVGSLRVRENSLAINLAFSKDCGHFEI